ncbi:hypothetical protein [Parapedobacter soli]|uniref:hypothetical protein n=1 Tax=Parapedobacter soli TaxID=416955 RepID=UPI0021C64615|nr:hypothetical protein [Parapedobacter soli]
MTFSAIRPLPLQLNSIKKDVFTMVFAAILLFALSLDGQVSTWDGTLMVLFGIIYLIVVVKTSKREPLEVQQEYSIRVDENDGSLNT